MKLPANVSKGEKATSEWANDVVNALRSLQPCPSADIGFVHTPNGWTAFLVDKPVAWRPPRLWKMSFGELQLDPVTLMFRAVDVLSKEIIEVLSNPKAIYDTIISYFNEFIDIVTNPDYNGDGSFSADDILSQIDAIVDRILLPIINKVDSTVERICGDIAPIGQALTEYFKEASPQNGDYIYTEELGICYIIFQETKEKYPTPNLIFRVAFNIGEAKYYAVTPFPFPDIAECVKTLLMSIVNWIKSFVGAMVNGIISKILDVKQALENAMEIADSAIEAGMDAISDVANSAKSLANAASAAAASALKSASDAVSTANGVSGSYNGLLTDVVTVKSNILGLSSELETQKGLVDNLNTRTAEFDDFQKNLKEITVLLRNGMSQVVKVSTTNTASAFATFSEVEMCEDGKLVKKELLMKNGNN